MVFVTLSEFGSTPLYALEDRVYKRVERIFVRAYGETVANRVLLRFMRKTLREISTNSYIDIMSAIPVI